MYILGKDNEIIDHRSAWCRVSRYVLLFVSVLCHAL